MAIQGFQYDSFMTDLLAYVQDNFDGWDDKTVDDIEAILVNIYPDAADADEAAQTFYTDYGAEWGLSPNMYFNAAEYRLAWAEKQFELNKVFSVEMALNAYDKAIGTAGDPYEHYLTQGAALGVNPSNIFDESDFLQSVIEFYALVDADGNPMEVPELRDLAISVGLTPLDFFVDYVAITEGTEDDLTVSMPAPPVQGDELVDTGNVTPPTNTFTVKAADTSVDEGQTMTYTIKADKAVDADTVFNFAVDASSTAGPDDFTGATAGTATIKAGNSEITFTVATKADNVSEFQEKFNVNVTDSNMKAVGSAVTTTINDKTFDLTAPVVTAAQTFSYAENQATAGTSLGKVAATDDTAVTGFTIAKVNGVAPEAGKELFAIDASGNISLTTAGIAAAAASNDYEVTPNTFTLSVEASDAAGNKSTATDVTVNVTNVDDDPPVLSTATGSTNKIVLAYNEALDTASIPSKGDFYVTQTAGNTTTVVDVSTVSMTSSSIELILGTAVTSGATVKVSYTPGTKPIQDTMGFDAANLSNQAVVTDTTAPTKASTSPVDNATGVLVGDNLVMTMSETVLAGTGSIVLYKSDGTVVETFNVATGVGTAGGTVAFSGTAVTINPFADLASSTNYYVKVDATAVKDTIGNLYAGIANTTDWSFGTPGASGTTGKTVSLTQTADNISPTQTNATYQTGDGDDTINALLDSGAATFSSTLDTVNGGGGTDILNAYGQSGANNMTNVTNVEKFTIRSGSTAGSLNMATTSGYTYLTNEGSAAALDFLGISSTSPTLTVQGATADTAFIHTATALQGASDSVNINVNGYSPTSPKGILLNSGIETLNFDSTGNASSFGIFTDTTSNGTALGIEGSATVDTAGYASATSLIFTGSANLTIANAFTGVKTLNLSAFTGNSNVSLVGNEQLVTVTGGTGNDTVTFSGIQIKNTTGVADSINLGAGTGDVLGVDGDLVVADYYDGTAPDFLTAVNAVVSNTEGVMFKSTKVNHASDITSISLAAYTNGIKNFIFNDTTPAGAGADTLATIALTNLTTSNILTFNENVTGNTGTTTGDDAVSIAGSSAGQTAYITLGGATIAGGAQNGGNIAGGDAFDISTGVSKAVITSNTDASSNTNAINAGAGAGTGAASYAFNSNGVSNFELNGATNISIVGDGGAAAATRAGFTSGIDFNASTYTGSSTIYLAAHATGDVFTGGSGADKVFALLGNDQLTGGAGNDSLHGGLGIDVLSGGDGDDTLVTGVIGVAGAAAAESLTGGNGTDAFYIAGASAVSLTPSSPYVIADFNASGEKIYFASHSTPALGTHLLDSDVALSDLTWSASAGVNAAPGKVINLGTLATDSGSTTVAGDLQAMISTTATAGKIYQATTSDDYIVCFNSARDNATYVAVVNESGVAAGYSAADGMTFTKLTGVTVGDLAAADFGMYTSDSLLTFTGTVAADVLFGNVLTGANGNDTFHGTEGADTITGGTGLDTVIGGTGADAIALGAADGVVDRVIQSDGDSILKTGGTAVGGTNFAATQTIIFANGVDVITNFEAGAGKDALDVGTAGIAITGIGVDPAAMTATKTLFFSGAYTAATGTFVIDVAGAGADTLLVDTTVAADRVLTTADTWVVLVGVDTDNLHADNCI